MKPQIEKMPVLQRVFLGECRTVVEVRLVAKESQEISVLGICADATVLSAECLSQEILFDGKLNVKAIVQDNEGNIASLNYANDFADKFKNNVITADTRADMPCEVVDLTYTLQDNVINAKCVVVCRVFALICDECDVLTDCDDLLVKKQNALLCERKTSIKQDFTVVDEVELKHDLSKILLAETAGVVTSLECEDGVVTAKGEFFTCVTYMRDDRDIRSMVVKTPFEEEFSASNADDGCVAFGCVKTKNTKVRVEMSEESSKEFSLEISAQLVANVIKTSEKSFVCDAFSLQNHTQLSNKTLNTCCLKEYLCHETGADAVVKVDGVDEVLCITNSSINLQKTNQIDSTLFVGGVVSANLLFVSEEKVLSCPLQLPFETKVQTGADLTCEISNACVTQICAKVVRGAINVDFGLKFGINCFECKKYVATADVQLLGEKQNDDCGIEILVGKKGMTAWDLQKHLGTSHEDLLACNPNLVLPLEQDKKILVYRKIN